jgi:two-component system response regulator GlrR
MRHEILLVDDDPDILKLLSLRLSSAGYQVRTAENAEQALSIADVRPPALVITDLRMPGDDGMTLFEKLQRRHPTLPVIILTAHGTIPEAVRATERGIFGFLSKPFDSHELLQKVESGVRLSGSLPDTSHAKANAWRRDIITCSRVMEDVLRQARLVAESNASVLICGESGTGKEILARAIYHASQRADQPFVAINCGAFPNDLLESELFGHVRGAFTGAIADHHGLFQMADGGTLFLDEIGDMPLSLQVKLLRALQEREIRPVGSTRTVPVDVRIISATHRNLRDMMTEKTFREDLYYRLNVVTLNLPPLAERREDIPLLAKRFLKEVCRQYGKPAPSLSNEAVECLIAAPWPGNIRQLLNVIEQAVALCTTPVIPLSLIQKALHEETDTILSLQDARNAFERDYLIRLLKITRGNVTHAAIKAKRNRTEFYKLLQRHNLTLSLFKKEES